MPVFERAKVNFSSLLNPEEYWVLESNARAPEVLAPEPLGHAVEVSAVVHSVTVCAWPPVFVQVMLVPIVVFFAVGL